MIFAGPPRWKHQRREFERSKDKEYWGLLFEQRCGKTPVLIDTAVHLFLQGKIDALVYFGPNGVHADFEMDYLPVFIPKDVPWLSHVWRSSKVKLARSKAARDALLKFQGLSIVCINTESIISKEVRRYLATFLQKRRALVAIDESLDISSKKAARTKVAIRIGMMAPYRRILDGTPLDAGPLGIWSQCEFLKPGALGFKPSYIMRGKLAMPGYFGFSRRYAEWEEQWVSTHSFETIKVDEETGKKQYRNLEELSQKLAAISSRVTRDQCRDMPPKIYEKRGFELSDAQRDLYDKLQAEYIVELREQKTVNAIQVLTRYMRLQQIASNFVPVEEPPVTCTSCGGDGCAHCDGIGVVWSEEDAEIVPVDLKNDARLTAFDKSIAQLPTGDQVVVWARFRRDLDKLVAWAQESGRSYVRYDGSVDVKQRSINKRQFQGGEKQFFFGYPVAGGRGLDLSGASVMLYYSHLWSLRWRRQSEDRAQHLAKNVSTLYLDLVAHDTIDDDIMLAVRNNREFADLVMEKKAWLQR